MTATGSPDHLAAAAVSALRARGWTLATAESLTAGLLAATVAEVPGASDVLRGGLVVYATDLKHRLADVPEDVLNRHGAVSAETARALAVGAARRCGADVGIGLTGVAGPDLQEGQPVGTVHVGVSAPGVDPWSIRVSLTGDRGAIRRGACTTALELLLGIVVDDDGNESGT
ncbi:nicotinamide-nucleotide amidohydrolase family protein [Rhodococcus sp. IEGM 1408]|uniref:CinA family protein n=1 Tax=Rhodococcus sp. IEGM 1408 TaxID=3082220 RepID=UPI002953CAC5|nr:nicotinamide-nucleotide amidohydrolase family protein [Rhodococcus sp. IEGM 1408]MDV8000404.1 nicotinamide-nucleotide amidohydrolase family protein [Rhodococcus sp. IEGM 1408]